AGVEDQLEIARCLTDPELLCSALDGELRAQVASQRPMTAALETKLREAVVACGLSSDSIAWADTAYPTVVERGLRMSPLLSANYLVALGDLQAEWRGSPGD